MPQTLEQSDSTSLRDNDESDKKQKSRRPANTAFRQQRLKAWQPILTPKTVLPLLFAVGVIFAPIGGLLLWASSVVEEIKIDYTRCSFPESDRGAPPCSAGGATDMPSDLVTSQFKRTSNSSSSNSGARWCREVVDVSYGVNINYSVPTNSCRIEFGIPNDIGPPVYLFYELTNFYQNHRRYVQSYDGDQLKGHARTARQVSKSNCDPLQTDEDLPIYPCGIIANSLFNDTFSQPVLLSSVASNAVNVTYNMTRQGIAWSTDAELYTETQYAYGEAIPPPNWRVQYPAYNESFPFPDLHTWEEFQVWMRTAGLPTFSKLALTNANETMSAGTYQITVNDMFPAYLYDGTKSILISTRTVMGGKNPFLGIAYIIVGGICLVLGAFFTATHLIKPRKLGDHNYLSWNTNQPTTATTTGRAPRPNEAP